MTADEIIAALELAHRLFDKLAQPQSQGQPQRQHYVEFDKALVGVRSVIDTLKARLKTAPTPPPIADGEIS